MRGQIAIIAGGGVLPEILLRAEPSAKVFAPQGVETRVNAERFHFERLMPFLQGLVDQGITSVVLAGAMQRPRLDPALFDAVTAQMVPRLLGAMQAGDDATLRAIIEIIEEAGLEVLGADQVAPSLLPPAGAFSAKTPSEGDLRDIERAASIVEALGRVDVGQGAVVAQGLCLAAESLPGTDAMLAFVAQVKAVTPDAAGAKGVLYKAPKPDQDRRVDLPALGPNTLRGAAQAGLAGISWQAGGVLLLAPEDMRALADDLGLFLWAREP